MIANLSQILLQKKKKKREAATVSDLVWNPFSKHSHILTDESIMTEAPPGFYS